MTRNRGTKSGTFFTYQPLYLFTILSMLKPLLFLSLTQHFRIA